MEFERVPIIRLELENLKTLICHAMGVEGSELEKAIEEAIIEQSKKILPEVNRLVKENMEEIITKKIREYFAFGKGREAIEAAIHKVIKVGK